MRMLDNSSIETDDVKAIQDDLNYYVESNQEPDFAENELLYEDLHLDETAGSKRNRFLSLNSFSLFSFDGFFTFWTV